MRIVVVGGGVPGLATAAIFRRLGFPCVTLLGKESVPDPTAHGCPPVILLAPALAALKYLKMDAAFSSFTPIKSLGLEGLGDLLLDSDQKVCESPEAKVLPEFATATSLVSTVRAEKSMYDHGVVPTGAYGNEDSLRHRLATHCNNVRFGVDLVSIEQAEKGEGSYINLSDGTREFADLVILTSTEGRDALTEGGAHTGKVILTARGVLDESEDLVGAPSSRILKETAKVFIDGTKTFIRSDNCWWATCENPNNIPLTSVPDVVGLLESTFPTKLKAADVIAPSVRYYPARHYDEAHIKDNVICVGSASTTQALHPALEATFAIEDAILLAHLLKDTPLETLEGYTYCAQVYQEIRKERRTKVREQHVSYASFSLIAKTGLGRFPGVSSACKVWADRVVSDFTAWRYSPELMGLRTYKDIETIKLR
eukprot:PhF_6_TR27815/c0_g1_i1/m.40567